jgi:MYXO-CTERM domain-containing protein
MSDLDGNMELHFNGYEGSASMVSLAIFIADTGYEAADNFSIHWGADPINGTLYSLVDTELEDAAGLWVFLEFDVSALGAGHLHVRGASNSGSEAYYIDAVSVYGAVVPAPGALALLGIAGLARRRRK